MWHSHAILSLFFILLSLAREHPLIVICLLCSFRVACKCDPGGSNNRNCFKYLGNCRCISGVEGKKCNRYCLFCLFVSFFLVFLFRILDSRSTKQTQGQSKLEGDFWSLDSRLSKARSMTQTRNVNWKFLDYFKLFGLQNVHKLLVWAVWRWEEKRKESLCPRHPHNCKTVDNRTRTIAKLRNVQKMRNAQVQSAQKYSFV